MNKQDWTKPMSRFAKRVAQELVEAEFIIITSPNTITEDAEAFARKLEDIVQDMFTLQERQEENFCRDCGTMGTRAGAAYCHGAKSGKPCSCSCHYERPVV